MKMFLRSGIVILIGIYFMIIPHSAYPGKDNIKLLLNYFNDATSTTPSHDSEKVKFIESHTNYGNLFRNHKTIEYLKNLFNNENSEDQQDENIKAQPIEQTTLNDNLELTTTIIPENTETSKHSKEISKDTVLRENSKDRATISAETTITSNEDEFKAATTDNILTELVPITTSADAKLKSEQVKFIESHKNSSADAKLNTGQTIEIQRSNADATINEAGVEILKNVSEVCGTLLGKRISFANQTTLMEYPWTVLLLYNTREIYHCGGSLITFKYVLTAAHCVAQQFYELTGVRLGEHDLSKERDCEPDIVGAEICSTTIDVKVVKIIIHHGYTHLSFKNDIALLRLEQDYWSRSFYPICIPPPEMTYTSTTAIVAGWGATETAIRSTVLRKAEVPILDMSKCRSIYRYSKFNDTTEICGSGVNEIDVCQGDSGGAIFYEHYIRSKQKYYQLGIISLGVRRCGDKRFLPAVFTKLKGFYKWIENNLEI